MRVPMPYRNVTYDPITGEAVNLYQATHAPGQGGSSSAAISVLSNWPKFNPDSRGGKTMPTNALADAFTALYANARTREEQDTVRARYAQAMLRQAQPNDPGVSAWQLYTDRMRREDEERAERQRLQQNQQRTFDRNWDWGAEDRRTSQMTPNPGESWDRFAMRLPVGMQGGGPGGGGGGGGFGVDARNFAEDQRRFNVTQANQQAALRARLDALRGLFGQGGGGGGMGGPPQGAPQQENPFLAQAARQGGPDRGELQNFLARLMQRGG